MLNLGIVLLCVNLVETFLMTFYVYSFLGMILRFSHLHKIVYILYYQCGIWSQVGMYISRLLVFQLVLIVPHWWQMCSYIKMKLILYNIYKRETSRNNKTSFNLTFRYAYDVISLNNPNFNDYNDVIYPEELECKDTTYAPKWTNYLDIHLEFEEDGQLYTRLYYKHDHFDFHIVNFSYLIVIIFRNLLHMVFLFLS